MTEDELEARLRATLSEAIPKLATSHRSTCSDAPVRPRRAWRSLAFVGATSALLIAGGIVIVGRQEPAEGPPPDTGTAASESSLATPPTAPTSAPPPSSTSTTSSTAPATTGVVPPGFGLVDAQNSSELGEEAAEDWGRRYLELLSEGDYQSAAVLLSAEGYTDRFSPNRSDLLPAAAEVSEALPAQLEAYCEGDAFCLPVYDIVPNDPALPCGAEEICEQTERAVFDRYNDGFMFRFALASADGTPAMFDRSSAGPVTATIVVGAKEGRVFVRWVPPSLRNGDPVRWLPQMQLPVEPAEFVVDVGQLGMRLTASSDGSNLCLQLDGGGVCTDPAVPPNGYVSGAVSQTGDDDVAIHLVAVASGVDIELRSGEPGESLEFIDRIETGIGDVTVWLFRGPWTVQPQQSVFTLPGGARFEYTGF